MKIYTRTGDQGKTSLYTGDKVYKNNPVIEASGAIDEANSALGIALACLPKETIFEKPRQQLEIIQHALFDVGAAVSTPRTSHLQIKLKQTQFNHAACELLEQWIDAWDQQLPPLKNFILPGGHLAGAHLHLSRSLIRRAERTVIPLYQQEDIVSDILIYLNRLSDYLFVIARWINHILEEPEIQWHSHQNSGS